MTCPHCQDDARCKGFRGRTVLSLLGTMRLQRHYYHCGQCHQGHCPQDQRLGLQQHDLTPAAEEVVALAGVQASFAEAAEKTLVRLAGLRLSESTVERTTEAAGARAGQQSASGQTFGPDKDWAWHKDAQGRTVAYVAADATGVGQQGKGGSKAEGRMAAVGMIYNPIPDERSRWAEPRGRRPPWQARYVAGLGPLADLGEPLRRQGAQVGMDRADVWVALSDGGSGLEDFFARNFPRVAAIICDFFHVAEYVAELGTALHPGQPEAAAAWSQTWCHRLKTEGGQSVLTGLRELEMGGRPAAVKECHATVVTYFENQVHRMDYPRYVSQGWHIGSGPIESACKTVIGQRMKGGGMRWGTDGADSLCHLRALFRGENGQWEGFWNQN
jgi:hypothetical protein